MAAALIGLNQITGGEWFLAIVCLSLAGAVGLFLLFPCNRKGRCRKRLLIVMLGAAAVFDLLLVIVLFPQGAYRNYGIGAAFAVLLYPVVLLVSGAAATICNCSE